MSKVQMATEIIEDKFKGISAATRGSYYNFLLVEISDEELVARYNQLKGK